MAGLSIYNRGVYICTCAPRYNYCWYSPTLDDKFAHSFGADGICLHILKDALLSISSFNIIDSNLLVDIGIFVMASTLLSAIALTQFTITIGCQRLTRECDTCHQRFRCWTNRELNLLEVKSITVHRDLKTSKDSFRLEALAPCDIHDLLGSRITIKSTLHDNYYEGVITRCEVLAEEDGEYRVVLEGVGLGLYANK